MDKVYFIVSGSMYALYILFLITLLLSCINFVQIILLKKRIFSDNIKHIQENFTISELDTKNKLETTLDAMRMTQTCNNKSLNQLHDVGKLEQKPFQIDCYREQNSGVNFYKKYKPYDQIYTADNIQNVQGSNYMNFQKNPNPYVLGYKLYDKNEVVGLPVGFNYKI
jgi:hypothetical protein